MKKEIKEQAISALSSAFCYAKPPEIIPFHFASDDLNWKRCEKLLRSSKEFDVHKNRIYYKEGSFVDALAKWGETLEFRFADQTFRYRALLVQYNGQGYGFAIRATGNAKITALPGLDLTTDELTVLLAIANEVSEPGKNVPIELINIVKNRMMSISKTEDNSYDEGALLNVLSDEFICQTMLCGFLSGIECARRADDHSRFAVNFVITRNSGNAACECLQSVLKAVDFTASDSYARCPRIEVRDKADLVYWEQQRGRSMLLNYANEKAIRPIWREFEQNSLDGSAGRFTSFPLLLGRSSLPPITAFEVLVPSEAPQLTVLEFQILRAAAANFLQERSRLGYLMQQAWHWLKVSGAEFIVPYPIAFMQAFSGAVGRILFTEADHQQRFKDICGESTAQQLEQQKSDSQALDRALKLLLDPARYSDEIIEKPETKEQAEQLLRADAVAFLYSPKKFPAVCFTKESILRLLHRVGFRDELINRFINLLKAQGIIEERRKSLSFANRSNGRFITIPLSKCSDFDVSLITAKS